MASVPQRPYRATFKLAAGDLAAASRLVRRRPILGGIAFALGAVAVGALTVLVTGEIAAGVLAIVGGVVGLVVFGLGVMERLTARAEMRSFAGMPVTFEFTEEGVSTVGGTGASSMPWSALTHVEANGRVIVLMRDRVAMAWLPTSAFASAAECQAALDFMRARIYAAHAPGTAEIAS